MHARIVEPVYAFDREVIPGGTEVEGRIIGFQKVGKWRRISTMLGGDCTPLREPQITFQALVLRDGTRIPIDTVVEPGSEKTVGLDSNFLARGRNIVLPANTSMQIRLTTAAPWEEPTTSLENVDFP